MKSALWKDVFREIKRSKSRFFSIFAIIALGAGFFAGLKATCPDMLETQEKYFLEQDLMDVRLVSTYGFNEKDVKAIRDTEGVREVYPTYSKDAFLEYGNGSNRIAKIMALPETMNAVLLEEGRLPSAPGECVVERNPMAKAEYAIGDTIKAYTTDADDAIEDSLIRQEWTVVGIVMSPQYISYDRGNTAIGNGSLDLFVMVPEENFRYEVYTEVYVTFGSTEGKGTFSDAYEKAMTAEKEKMEALAERRETERLSEIRADAEEKLEKARKELADGEAEAEEKLGDAEKELADAKKKLEDGEKELKTGWRDYYKGYNDYLEGKADFEKEIADGEKAIADGWEQYEDGQKQLKENKERFENENPLSGYSDEELQNLSGQIQFVLAKGPDSMEWKMTAQMLGVSPEELPTIPYAIEATISAREQLANAEKELEQARKELRIAEKELEEGRKTGQKELDDAWKEIVKGRQELLDAEDELADGWNEYNDGMADYKTEKAKAEKEIADGKKEIADAEKELRDLKEPVWYVFTREDNPGYNTYESDANRIESVSKVFPIFFLMVALLVCLTTMTRMVEEERTHIGTMKALGYRPGTVAVKFLLYSSLASAGGAVFGIAVGSVAFPLVIYSAYAMMYKTLDLKLVPEPGMWVLVLLVCIACTTAAALIPCLSELRAVPAQLMRPKAPKAGKRVILEYIPFIWKRLGFTKKVTVRNLFRYKKRIFMTILGIAGCTALTLTGFGLYSSISIILEKQYDELFHYDLIVALNSDTEQKERDSVFEELERNEISQENLPLYMKAVDYKGIGDTSLVVTDEVERLGQMVSLVDHKTGEALSVPDEGVIITERFSELAGLSAGDPIRFICSGAELQTKVAAIAENYTLHFIYMTETQYERLCGEKAEANVVFTKMSDAGEAAQEELSQKLMTYDGVMALSFVRNTKETFGDTVKNLNYVVYLIIASAAMLAFVVLYNLTNINITERIREIATIKVLGFYDGEVSSYVFRENILLTLMGDGVGLVVGIGLHKFVIQVAQTDAVMFGRDLPWWCFVAAFLLTVGFALAVNGIMYFKLRKISMVESLKSVE